MAKRPVDQGIGTLAQAKSMIDSAKGDQKLLAQASDLLRQELSMNSDNLSALFQQGRSLQQRGLIDDALASYERYFAQRVSVDFAANFNAGELYELRGDLEKAEEHFQACVIGTPKELLGWERLILILLKRQRIDDARSHYESLQKVAPGSDVVKRLSAKFPA